MQWITQSEGTASLRRLYFHLVDATDGKTPETGEAGGQPQISKAGGTWTNTTNVLVHVGQGYYYVEPLVAEVDTKGVLGYRYKSANTCEFQSTALVVGMNPFDGTAGGLSNLDAAVSSRSSLSSANVKTAVDQQLNTAVPGSPTADSLYERIKTLDTAYTATRGGYLDNLDAAVSTRSTPAQVNAEVSDVLNTDVYGEPSVGAPPVSASLRDKLSLIYSAVRNRLVVSKTERKLYADDTTTVLTKGTVSDNGSVYDRGEFGAP